MILYNATDIKVGSDSVLEVRLGTDIVWSSESDPDGIWLFNNPSNGDTITVKATFSPGVSTAHWGDGESDTLISGQPTTHTYQ